MEEGVLRLGLSIAAATAILLTICGAGAADNYPTRPIILVIPLPPGGTNDIMARAVSDKMSAALGQRIVIEIAMPAAAARLAHARWLAQSLMVTRLYSATPQHWPRARTFSAMPVTIRARISRRSGSLHLHRPCCSCTAICRSTRSEN